MEAMEDFTGGVGETYETKSSADNLFTVMKKALDRGSLMGCSIDVNTPSPMNFYFGRAPSVLNLSDVLFLFLPDYQLRRV